MRSLFAASIIAVALATSAHAEDYTLNLKDHKFAPNELTIPANTKVTITVVNSDAAAAEFESHDLKREKVINPGESATITVGPLDAGTYAFEDEFHDETAQGNLIVK